MNILVLAAHPDDEVLGMGGTIKKMSKKKNKIHLLVITEGASAQYNDSKMKQIRKESCKKSSKILGISSINFLDYPDMKLDTIPQLKINQDIEKEIRKRKPEIIYTTPNHDLNSDHRIVHDSTLVASRPQSGVKKILSYEIPGIVKKTIHPNVFENIESELIYKLKAMRSYKSEIEKFPHPRSLKAIENLSIHRGIESGLKNAEAFQLLRNIIK
jgi:LmbE family N-acetylglucosaminyl deacetylase